MVRSRISSRSNSARRREDAELERGPGAPTHANHPAEATRACEPQLGDETAALRESLRAFAELGRALIGTRDTGETLDAVIPDGPGCEGLGDLVAKASVLARHGRVGSVENHVLGGYSRFRRAAQQIAGHASPTGVLDTGRAARQSVPRCYFSSEDSPCAEQQFR